MLRVISLNPPPFLFCERGLLGAGGPMLDSAGKRGHGLSCPKAIETLLHQTLMALSSRQLNKF